MQDFEISYVLLYAGTYIISVAFGRGSNHHIKGGALRELSGGSRHLRIHEWHFSAFVLVHEAQVDEVIPNN